MSQVTEQSVRFQTALASIKLIQASAVLDLTEDDFDFLTSNKVWIATDRSRARRCVEGFFYGLLYVIQDYYYLLTNNKFWISTDLSRARRCVEACFYGTLDFVGYPRFPAPV